MNPVINIYFKSGQILPDITATSGKKLCSVYSWGSQFVLQGAPIFSNNNRIV